MRAPALLPLCCACLLASCMGGAEGPLKGVLVVYPEGMERQADSVAGLLQRTVTTIDAEQVFAFSFCTRSEFEGSLRSRRTILFLADSPAGLPGSLEQGTGVWWARDVWARRQRVFGAVLGATDPGAVSDSLEKAYNNHLYDYLFQEFVSTSMSSTDRMDSLAALGFTMDVPRSYRTAEWRPDDGFVQFQRPVSDEGLMMLSIRWLDDSSAAGTVEQAVSWRQDMARRFFWDASSDSVDLARLETIPISPGGLSGWRLTGAWINPAHLNAGAFTSYVLRSGGRSFILDAEVFNPGEEKEPYIREGWLLMSTFAVEGQDARAAGR